MSSENGTPANPAAAKKKAQSVEEMFPEGVMERKLDFAGNAIFKFSLVESSFTNDDGEEIVIPAGPSIKYKTANGQYSAKISYIALLQLRKILNNDVVLDLIKLAAREELAETQSAFDD